MKINNQEKSGLSRITVPFPFLTIRWLFKAAESSPMSLANGGRKNPGILPAWLPRAVSRVGDPSTERSLNNNPGNPPVEKKKHWYIRLSIHTFCAGKKSLIWLGGPVAKCLVLRFCEWSPHSPTRWGSWAVFQVSWQKNEEMWKTCYFPLYFTFRGVCVLFCFFWKVAEWNYLLVGMLKEIWLVQTSTSKVVTNTYHGRLGSSQRPGV